MLDLVEIDMERRRKNLEEKKLKESEEISLYGKTIEQMKREQQEEQMRNSDHPDTMEDGTALLLYIVIMIGGAIFVDRWLIWIVATVIYFNFRNRHKK